MLVPVQPKGTKPPLFFVHGAFGTMPIGHALTKILGPERPLYAVDADGLDGRRRPHKTAADMTAAYLSEILEVCPTGQLFVGGMCQGGLVALELATKLTAMGRQVGPAIIADPPGLPVLTHFAHKRRIDPNSPIVWRQLYGQARNVLLRYANTPSYRLTVDMQDPKQAHAATVAALASMLAFSFWVPNPFEGDLELIISREHALRFLHPDYPWQKFIRHPHPVHIIPCDHHSLWRSHIDDLGRLIEFILENSSAEKANAQSRPARSA